MVHHDNFKTPNKPIDEDMVIERIQTNITDGDIRRYFGDGIQSKIVKYSDLANYDDVDELMPKDKDFRILLVEENYNSGHWVCLLKYDNVVEYFDPYGTAPEGAKKHISKIKNKLLGQDEPHLIRLLKNSKKDYKLIYSKTKFQKLKNGVNTCGRWIILRIICMKDLNMDLQEFKKMIELNRRSSGLPNDALVAVWIG